MAKKDRRNRDSGLGDIIDEFSSSIDAMNSEFEQNLNAIRGAAPPPLVDDSDEDDEEEDEDGFSPFAGTVSALRFLVEKGFAGILLLGAGCVFLGRCSLWPVRKVASFFRSAEEDEEEEIDEADVPAASRPVPAAPKATVAQKADAAEMLADYDDEDEEDGILSTGQKWLFRGGVLAAMMVVASAGYFGYKTWTAKSELGRQEAVAENSDTATGAEIIEDNTPKTPVDPLLASAQAPKPQEAGPTVKVAEKAPKIDTNLKTDKKNEPPVAKTENKKDDAKTVSPPPAPPIKKDAPSLPKVASKPETSTAENKDGKDGKESEKKTGTPSAAPVVAASPNKKPDEKPVIASTEKKPNEKPPVAPPVKPEMKPADKAVAASPAKTAEKIADKKPEEKPPVVAPLTVSAPKPSDKMAEKPENKTATNDLWAQAASQPPEVAPASSSVNPWAVPEVTRNPSPESSAPVVASLKTDSVPSVDPWLLNAEKAAPTTDSRTASAPTDLPSFAAPPSVASRTPTVASTTSATEPGFPPLSAPVTPTSGTPLAETPAAMSKLPALAAETAPIPPPESEQLKPLAKRTPTPVVSEINEPAPGIPFSTGTSLPKTAYDPMPNNTPSTSNQAPGIPDQSGESRAVFGQMPTPPVLDTTPTDTTMIPPAREAPKAETIPSIRHTGSVRTVAGSNPEPENRTVSEPSPGIPVAGQTATTFSRPAAASKPPENERPGIVSRDDRVASGQPFVPPVIASSTTSATPSAAPTAASTTMAVPTVPVATAASAAPTATMTPAPKNNEPSPTIPAERAVSTAAFTTPVTPMLPQHTELAKTETPLGSRLQNSVQDLREQQEATPRIRFTSAQGDSEAGAPTTGAVRFNPETARTVKPTLMSVPADSNAVTELSVLLPTGTPLPEAEGTEPIPTGESAPQVMMATANPGYGRSLRNRNPAAASLDPTQRTGDRENRATSFKQRLNEEIKRSPTETERYVVQDGDNYMTISDRAFGTGLLFRALAEHNRRQLGIDYRLQPGTVIEIPPAEFLQTNYNDLYQRGRRRSENRPSTSTGTSPSSSSSSLQPIRQGIRYVVQEGDTVFNLATNRLKDTPKWREIMALNAGTIADPRDPLPAGTEILLPVSQTARTGSVQR